MSQLSAYWDSLLEEVLGDAANTQKSPKNESSESQTTIYEAQIDELVRSCGDGKLVLVLGSGISSNFGLPRWNKLLYKLLQKKSISEKGMLEANTIESIFSTVSPIVIARFACHLAKENFNEVVREKLYDYDEIHQQNKDVKNSWLSSITQLCESKRVDSIITYNFDDILEQHLATKNFQFTSYDRNHLKIENNGLPIYHVHGFLQQHVAATEDTRIIFSEEDYHEQYHDPYSWNTLIQLDKYRTRPCLFIGTSLTDPNQRRLLELSKTYKISDSIKHYVLRGREGLVVESQISNLEQIILAEKYMERFYNKLDEDFGINTIWVDKFNEIPAILNKITEKFTPSK
jgi:hypothetical protein